MTITPGQIVKNLETAPVVINKVHELGDMYSITYTGINTKRVHERVIDREQYETLEIVTQDGEFNFQGEPTHFLLFSEAERIYSAYMFDPLFAVNCSIVDPLPHQVEAVYKYLLPQPRIRFLLADDTGAGKTIMTGLLLKELIMRGLVERILIITPGGLTRQWQEDEMALKFNLPFKLVNRASFQSDPNIFSHSNRLITSIDFLRGEDILNVVKELSWDIIIVDEAHKLSAFDYGKKRYVSKRYQALETLAGKCEHLLLLTATPHRGRRDTFKNLLQLLDEDIFASDSLVTSRIKQVEENGINKFFIRRLKEDMKDWKGKKLFKERHTKTTLYTLTDEEKKLYDDVTRYLMEKRKEAAEDANIHVSLALMVMQRRLTSSIYAIMRTLKNRYNALKELLDQLVKNPELWKQKQKFDYNMETLEDFDELDDQEKESLEEIFSDPRKFRLFTTAKSLAEIKNETEQVKRLMQMAESLYDRNIEERKFKKLRQLLQSEGVLEKNEKLVIFTEHKDTLQYLEQRLKNSGYTIEIIHGAKSVEERRQAQTRFAQKETQILIATDAAGEGINLQFCRLMINWDIPWNPNRLEQRMGRIHRYGQQEDVLVFNMVAENTLEGKVLRRLLEKLDLIREQMGDDRVYDVISDIFQDVPLDDIIKATFNGETTDYLKTIDNQFTTENLQNKIQQQKEQMASSSVDYKDAGKLKERSDERRLQPIYIRLFFEKAFKALDGRFTEVRKSIFRIDRFPEQVARLLKQNYNILTQENQTLFCFDKQVFLDYRNTADLGHVHYINPGNPVFDALVNVVRTAYKEDVLKGAVLVSPEDSQDYFAFLVKSQIIDNRPHKENESIAHETLRMVITQGKETFKDTSPAKFIDLHAPKTFAKTIESPKPQDTGQIVQWSFDRITRPQFQTVRQRIENDAEKRKEYIEEAFKNATFDLTAQINDLQDKIIQGDQRVRERIQVKQRQIKNIKEKKKQRLEKLDQVKQLSMKSPQVLGCAYVRALSNVEYKNHFGMSRDHGVEAIAMQVAMEHEKEHGWTPEDVSNENAGYDIRSVSPEEFKRYIEVKGRSREDGVMLSENEMNRLAQLGESAWLYIVVDCPTKPRLFRFQDPANQLRFEVTTRGIQYYLPLHEWKPRVN
jgi:superfamily II DNA or RNA helicase